MVKLQTYPPFCTNRDGLFKAPVFVLIVYTDVTLESEFLGKVLNPFVYYVNSPVQKLKYSCAWVVDHAQP